MNAWLRRNWLAFLVIAVAVVVIGLTVSVPKWREDPVSGRASVTVPAGESYDMGGVTMRLRSVDVPVVEPTFGESSTGRVIAYLLTRERDGEPAGPPDGTVDCRATFTDGRRQWQQPDSFEMKQWAETQGYTSDCWDIGPLLMSMTVPEDAHITVVGIGFRKNVEVADDEAMPDSSALWTVVEFQTG